MIPKKDDAARRAQAVADMTRLLNGDGVRDRPAEVWEALLAIADAAGGDWPDKARAACRHFVLDSEPEQLSLGARLLQDLRTAFGEREAMFSADIISALTADDDAEWTDFYGKPLDQRRLAKELGRYGVKPRQMRIGNLTRKGYAKSGPDGLAQAWARYLPAHHPSGDETAETSKTSQVSAFRSGSRVSDKRNNRNTGETAKLPPDQQKHENVSRVSDVSQTGGEQRAVCRLCGQEMSFADDIATGAHAGCALTPVGNGGDG
ncbi:DUF3631 domain-containing protein [Gordonia paraffinivorans]|uniref:DUF3631 domain-containing protein n=1 Tax=Gordonia paraffinivorans TaxID=175628 RepID=UPI00289B6133|nr:DUF3631 domain-containing protein [Gordonia paraffinivorans]